MEMKRKFLRMDYLIELVDNCKRSYDEDGTIDSNLKWYTGEEANLVEISLLQDRIRVTYYCDSLSEYFDCFVYSFLNVNTMNIVDEIYNMIISLLNKRIQRVETTV